MKTLYTFLLLALISLSVTAQNSWSSKTPFGGTARYAAVGFAIGDKLYIGFSDVNGTDFWEYDTALDTWTPKASFPGAGRYYAVGFSIGTKGYVGTGYSGVYKNDFWEYNSATDTWTQKTNFPGSARSGAIGFSIGNKGYVGTGRDGSTHYNDFYEYNPANNSWTQKQNFGGTARFGAVGFSIGAKGYVGTGVDNSSNKNDFWEYDPTSDSWTQKTDFGGTARYLATGFSIGNKGYIGTGCVTTSSGYFSDFWEWNQAADTWTSKTNYPNSIISAVGLGTCTKGYIGTGAVCCPTKLKDFTEYTPSITPSVGFTASQTSFCVGTCINFTDTSTIAPTSWNWTFPGGTPSSSTSQNPTNICFDTAGTYTATLIASNSNCSLTATKTITVKPNSNFSQSPTICNGDSIMVGTKIYKTSGNYSDTLTAANGCDSIVTTNLTVSPLPIATITASGATIFCQGDSVNLSANTGVGLTYQWKKNGTNLSGATSSIYIVNAMGSYTVVIDSNSCSKESNAISVTVKSNSTFSQSPSICNGDSIIVGIKIYKTAATYKDTLTAANGCDSIVTTNLTVLSNNTFTQSDTICNGQSITVGSNTHSTSGTFIDTLTSANGCDSVVTTNLTVNPNSSFSQSDTICQGQSISVGSSTHSTNGTFKDTLTAANGCDSIVTTNLTVNSLPNITITGNTSICDSGSTTLTASGGIFYSWNTGDTTASITDTLTNTTIYTVTVTNGNGCSASKNDTVTVGTTPSATISVNGDTAFCEGASTTILNANTGTGLSYQWERDGVNISGAISSSFIVDTFGGNFTVEVCKTNCCTESSPVNITIFPLPAKPTIQKQKDTILICLVSATSYQWYLNGSAISGATNQRDTARQKGAYKVEITDANDCKAMSDTMMVDIFTGILSVMGNYQMKIVISPNPFSEMAIIEITNSPSLPCSLVIYDVLGQEVLKQKIVNQKMQIKRGNLPSGIYFYQLKNEKGILANGKLIMQ